MICTPRFALAALVSFALSATNVLAIDYGISVVADPLTVNGFDETNDNAELTLAFELAAATGTPTCAAYAVSGAQCDTGTSIGPITTTPTDTLTAVSVAVDIDLANIATDANAAAWWSYDDPTHVGTISFCTRCHTTDPTAGEIDYAEVLATVTVTMQEDIPAGLTASVQETTATTDSDTSTAAYVVNAYQCSSVDKSADTSNLAQGDFLSVCVNFAQAGVDCDHFESLSLDTFAVVTGGAIGNALITTGNDSSSVATDGTCIITTQFPSSLVPSDGSLGSISITGSVVLHFGRRKLRVSLNGAESSDKKGLARGLQNEETVVDFETEANVKAADDVPFGASNSAGSSSATVGMALLGAVAGLFVVV